MAGVGICESGYLVMTRYNQEFRLETRNGLIAGIQWPAINKSESPIKVLALHGWLDNAASFQPLAEYLPDCEILAIDFPGHGHSDWRAGNLWYHFIDYLEDVALVQQHLGWGKFHLLGHSLGGAIASLWAAAKPKTLQSLSIIEGLGPLADTAENTAMRLSKALDSLNRLEDKQLRVFDSIEQAAKARAKSGGLELQLARILVERSLNTASEGLGWCWSTDPRLMLDNPNRYTENQVLNLMQAITTPLLLLHGDPLPDFINIEMMKKRITTARVEKVVCIKGHHHLHMQHPQQVATEIKQHIHKHRLD